MRLALIACAAACSKSAPPPPPPAPRAPAPVAPTRAAITPAVDEPVVPDDLGTIEDSDVDAPGIHVHVRWQTMTGTTHVAEDVAIRTAGGTLRLDGPAPGDTLESPPASPPLPDRFDLPMIERILALDADRWVLLGWSSHGGGMQAEHAWIVEDDRGGPRILDVLVWTTDRSHAGLAIDPAAGVRIGIPLPGARSGLHDAGEWTLDLERGGRRLDLDDVERLPATRTPPGKLRGHYTPPFHIAPSERGWDGRIVWFTAGTRFAPPR